MRVTSEQTVETAKQGSSSGGGHLRRRERGTRGQDSGNLESGRTQEEARRCDSKRSGRVRRRRRGPWQWPLCHGFCAGK